MKQPVPASIALLSGNGNDSDLYVACATVTGGPPQPGRVSSHAGSRDGGPGLELCVSRDRSGNGGGAAPEQLFAAGYAASFHGALMLLATRRGLPADGTEVSVTVTFGRDPADGMSMLSSRVRVSMPGIARIAAAELVRNAERVCPYAKMARQGIENSVILVGHKA